MDEPTAYTERKLIVAMLRAEAEDYREAAQTYRPETVTRASILQDARALDRVVRRIEAKEHIPEGTPAPLSDKDKEIERLRLVLSFVRDVDRLHAEDDADRVEQAERNG